MDVKETGVQIRVPATANLMIDSQDRILPTQPPYNFSITKQQSILNGFFNRIGLTELCLEWNYPNINQDWGNTFEVSIGPGNFTATVPAGFYTFQEFIDELVVQLNAVCAPSVFSVTVVDAQTVALTCTDNYIVEDSPLAHMLFPGVPFPTAPPGLTQVILDPDLRPFRYLDFVSSQLTYNQELKDGATNNADRNVLLRWYFSWDTEPQYDGYGYPILMGYRRFTLRRAYNPPKQIKWDPRQPVGQLSFEVYTNDLFDGRQGVFPPGVWAEYWDWLATLQVSEN